MAGIRVGVDVGGTNTDAVVMAGRRLLGWAKTPTTADVTGGIVSGVREALSPRRDRAVRSSGRHDRHDPLHQRRRRAAATGADGHRAARAAGHGLGAAVRRLAGRPPSRDRRPRLPGARRLRVRRPGDRAARRGRATRHRRPRSGGAAPRPSRSARSSARSARTSNSGRRRSSRRASPTSAISLSHEIGRLGLLERENACILNACLSGLAVDDGDRHRRARSRSLRWTRPSTSPRTTAR